jgi:predicted DNA binding protein
LARKHDATINVRSCRPHIRDGSTQIWVEILAHDQSIDTIADEISNQVVDSEIVRVKTGKAFGLVVCPRCPVAVAMKDLKCAASSQRVDRDGSAKIEMLFSDKEAFKQFVERLRRESVRVDVLSLTSNISDFDEDRTTARQEQIIRKAFELGYYDYPRRIRQKQLANACGIGSSTLSELLRRAERNIIVDRSIRNAA